VAICLLRNSCKESSGKAQERFPHRDQPKAAERHVHNLTHVTSQAKQKKKGTSQAKKKKLLKKETVPSLALLDVRAHILLKKKK
jgi:hypothetical protein